jgi:uncharacterized repeat protein (TIGR02059 family)
VATKTVTGATAGSVTITADDAGALTAGSTTFTVVPSDSTAPTRTGQTVNAATLTITYDEALDNDPLPAPADFTVKVGNVERTVSSVAISGSQVILTLASPVTAGQVVTLRYIKGANPIQDEAGNDAADIDPAVSVTNTTGGEADPQPSMTSSSPSDGAASGPVSEITVNFSESVTVTSFKAGVDGSALSELGGGSGTSVTKSFAASSPGLYRVEVTFDDGATAPVAEVFFFTIEGPSGSDPQPTAASAGPGEGGSLSNGSFTATWTSSTFSDDVKLVLDPDPAGPIPGLETIGMRLSVRVFRLSDNAEITSLADTLKVLLGTGPAGSGVAFSDDGVNYAQLGEVFTEDLAPGTEKAFFTRPDGTKVLMLRTLTFFIITKTGGFVAPAPPSAVGLGGIVEFGTLVLRWTSASDPDGINSYELWVDDQRFAVLGGVQYETRIAPFDANDMRVFHIRAVDGKQTLGMPSNKVRVVPNVTGLAEADARAVLAARGFAVETTIESADAPAGQVVSQDPPSPTMANLGSTVRLAVGAVPQGRALFTMQIASAPRIVIGRQKVLNIRIAVTEPARVRASLSRRLPSGKRWMTWSKSRIVQAGATIVRLRVPKNVRPGTHLLRVRAESVATGEVTHRTTPVRVVRRMPARAQRAPLEVVVVTIGDKPELPTPTLDLDERFRVSETTGDAVFEVTTETATEVEVVVIDVDAEGATELIRALRLVYPDLAIVALTSRENVGKATRAGATVELMKPVSPGLLAAVVERLAGG